MTGVSSIKHHDIHEVVTFLNKSSHSVLKGSFFVIEGIIGIAILVSVLLFVIVFLSFLFNSIFF